jgi:hypothetical protein
MTALILALSLALSPPAHAGWWSNFCARWIVAEDPSPYADRYTDDLLWFLARSKDPEARKELEFRKSAHMLTAAQEEEFRELTE